MPADRLTTPAPHAPAASTSRAVLDILAGADLHQTAARAGITPDDLTDAVTVFQHAGHEALAAHTDAPWRQLFLHFTDWHHAEETAATHLLPLLNAAGADNKPACWWFTRKHPCWRLRVRSGPNATDDLHHGLDRLVADGHLHRWWPGIYEPEIAAFGGTTGMEAAHDLFTADSHEILTPSRHVELAVGRRELSILLCTVMMRAAGCEWYEQGDIWHRVITEKHRSHLDCVNPERLQALVIQLRTLLTADLSPDGPLLGPSGPLAPVADWAAAFRDAGRALGEAVRAGNLNRGLRRVLSLHVIFHWNRCGFSLGAQSTLAWAARTAILDPPDDINGIAGPPGPSPSD